ncbi:MAG: serine/threonine protein kinase, partial [Myxococcales bacterium]|nr:serine/threonine protein kinase [Myxococcales bacterium]
MSNDEPSEGAGAGGEPLPPEGLRATITQCFAAGRPPREPRPVLPLEGEVVGGHYRLVELLGEGAFGRVYRAERTDVPEHRVALKLTTRAALAGRNVERELVMLAAAGHPNVVQLKDHGLADGYVWFTMPLLEGETLSARLARGPLGLREAHDIFLPIARGLEALHAAGLRHQDLKPDNVFLARFAGRVHPVILDLGVAVECDSSFVAGTVLFGAPEQVVALLGTPGGLPLSDRMDVYCLAATLLYALVGPANFPGEDASGRDELAAAFREREQAPLRPDALPALKGAPRARLAAALGRWLRHAPGERPSAGELALELGVLLAQDEERELGRQRALERQRVALVRLRFGAAAMLAAALGVGAYAYSKRETLRLADELAAARREGARSFGELDTCTAAHALAARDLGTCAT